MKIDYEVRKLWRKLATAWSPKRTAPVPTPETPMLAPKVIESEICEAGFLEALGPVRQRAKAVKPRAPRKRPAAKRKSNAKSSKGRAGAK